MHEKIMFTHNKTTSVRVYERQKEREKERKREREKEVTFYLNQLSLEEPGKVSQTAGLSMLLNQHSE